MKGDPDTSQTTPSSPPTADLRGEQQVNQHDEGLPGEQVEHHDEGVPDGQKQQEEDDEGIPGQEQLHIQREYNTMYSYTEAHSILVCDMHYTCIYTNSVLQ